MEHHLYISLLATGIVIGAILVAIIVHIENGGPYGRA